MSSLFASGASGKFVGLGAGGAVAGAVYKRAVSGSDGESTVNHRLTGSRSMKERTKGGTRGWSAAKDGDDEGEENGDEDGETRGGNGEDEFVELKVGLLRGGGTTSILRKGKISARERSTLPSTTARTARTSEAEMETPSSSEHAAAFSLFPHHFAAPLVLAFARKTIGMARAHRRRRRERKLNNDDVDDDDDGEVSDGEVSDGGEEGGSDDGSTKFPELEAIREAGRTMREKVRMMRGGLGLVTTRSFLPHSFIHKSGCQFREEQNGTGAGKL